SRARRYYKTSSDTGASLARPLVERDFQVVTQRARVVSAEAFEEGGGHERVRALDRERYFGDDPAVKVFEEQAEHLRAADDEDVAVQITFQRESRLPVPQPHDRLARLRVRAPRQYDVQTTGQRPLQSQPSPVAHHAGASRRLLL